MGDPWEGVRRTPGRTLRRAKSTISLADEDLMVLVQRGDARAFEAIYDRHGAAAFSLAYRIAGNRAAAEDIVQEAFLSVWRSSVRYQPERGNLRSWLLSVVHNRAIDALRRSPVPTQRQGGPGGD